MKMLKKFAAVLLSAAICPMFSACRGNSDTIPENAENSAETSAETTTVSLSPEERIHQDMVDRSFVSFGNTYRLENKLSKAAGGETVTVAYLGGSITEGIGAPDKESQ